MRLLYETFIKSENYEAESSSIHENNTGNIEE